MGTSVFPQTLVFDLPMLTWSQVGSAHIEVHTLGMSTLSLSAYRMRYCPFASRETPADVVFAPIFEEFPADKVVNLDFFAEASGYWLSTPVEDSPDLLCIIYTFGFKLPESGVGIPAQEYYNQLDGDFAKFIAELGCETIHVGGRPSELARLGEMSRILSPEAREILSKLPTR